MIETAKPEKGTVVLNAEECKGCGLCVSSCSFQLLRLAEHLNHYGYHPAVYEGHGCTGCGMCFYVCPEPGAITVYKAVKTLKQPEKAVA